MAQALQLANGVIIRVVSAPAFVATKLEAFLNRGNGDFLASHDLEDVLNVVDGRDALADELQHASMQLQAFVADTFAGLLAKPDFINSLPGLVADADRASVVRDRLQQMATSQMREQGS
jgi:predicted nucleotidyltransferase